MTVTVTPTVEAGTGYGDPPRVQLDVADTGSLTEVTVTRLNPDGRTIPVRTDDGGPLLLSSGVGLVYDYEAPFGQAVIYSTLEDPATASTPVTVDETRAWLTHPGIPEISVPIVIADMGDRTYATQRGVFHPMGRATAVVQTDGRRKAAEFTLTLYTPGEAERVALETLLDDTGALLLNVPVSKGWGVTWEYLSVGDVVEQRQARFLGEPARKWQMACTVVDRPAGGTQAERTLVDLLTYPSLASLAAAYDTLFDVLAGP